MTNPAIIGPVFDPVELRLLKAELLLLDPRARDALLRHGYGQVEGLRTLDELGQKHGVTRERIRQLEIKAKSSLRYSMNTFVPGWRRQLAEAFADRTVIHFSQVAHAISTDEVGLSCTPIILEDLSLQSVKGAKWWYSDDPQAVELAIESLSPSGPILKSEWDEALRSSGLPSDFRETAIGLIRVVKFGKYFVRKNSQQRDKVAAVLMDGALSLHEIRRRTNQSPNSVRGVLDNSDDFISLSKGRWALVGTVMEPKYTSTLPAILDILREQGPLRNPDLIRRVTAVHDVTPGRIYQCLDDYRIGRMPDGRIWLVEHGAVRPTETEPKQPDSIVAVGDKVGVRMTATYDHARGSGFFVHPWLSWRLGLRAAPQSMMFDSEIGVELKVTRTGNGASLSSIRAALDHYGLVEGCDLVIILDAENRTWRLNHACVQGNCPAARDTET